MRNSLFLSLFLALLVSCGENDSSADEVTPRKKHDAGLLKKFLNTDMAPFYHGVASGDPTHNAVIIWTRVTPLYEGDLEVDYEMATDEEFSIPVKKGKIKTGPARDYTVKADVTGLEPDTYYYYRFRALGKYSVTGRTHTFPVEKTEVKLAFASCSNFAWGYFNAYAAMAEDTLDAVIHLGDYIYEHETGTYSSKVVKRDHIPAHELITLDDYRTRYAQYRLDKDLQRVHQVHPFIVEWDDHELANNAYDKGAQNHQSGEGDWDVRRAFAIKAYYEWLPVRENEPRHLYRSFSIGNLVKLVMLDNRTEGRTQQVSSSADPEYMNPHRSLLGKKQFDWSVNELTSGEPWKIIANPVLFGEMHIPGWAHGDFYMDGWDGYPVEKHRWVDSARARLHGEMIFVTGDFHSSFALTAGYTKNGKYTGGWNEFVVPSISSGNYDEDMPMDTVLMVEKEIKNLNRNVLFDNLHDHGYVVLTVSQQQATASFHYVSTVTSPDYKRLPVQRFAVKPASR